jgi:choline dehydrogenase-like flavoprotein
MEHPRHIDRYRVRHGKTGLGDLLRSNRIGPRRLTRLALSEQVRRDEGLLNWHADMQFGYAGQDDDAWLAVRRLAIAVRHPWNESPYFQDAGGGRLRLRASDLATALQRPDKSVLAVLGAITGRPELRRWLEVSSGVEQMPHSGNRLELMSERDEVGMPRVRVHWAVGELEERTLHRAREILLEELRRLEPEIERVEAEAGDPIPDRLTGTWHQLGTARMDDDPKRGVVDRNLAVHGIGNLSLSSGAVFPIAGSGPPTVTIVQLSLRLADHLAERLRSPVPVGGRVTAH